jgi:hypothetical protein
MSLIVTTDFVLQQVAPPALPQPGVDYSRAYHDQLNNVLRLYFNRLQSLMGQLQASATVDGSGLQFPNGAFHQDGHTTLSANIGNGTTTPIPVVSTDGFLSAGGLIVQNEIIKYTGKTPTTFTGITRGAYGTSSSAHTSGTAISEAQVITPPATQLPIAFTTTDTSNGVSIDPTFNTRVVFAVAGYYNIQFSTQIINYTTADDNVTMWFRKNGVDIPNSAGIITIPSKHGSSPGATITSWNIILDVTVGQYIELMMTSDTGNSVVATYPPGVAPSTIHPASPSVILTATFVSAL